MRLSNLLSLLAILLFVFGCAASAPLLAPDADDLTEKSPAEFTVKFETTKGDILIDIKREYSPLAVDRFYYLVKNNYYSFNRFFRVLPGFVVQWGMKGVPQIDNVWSNLGIKDEKVKLSNTKGTLSFARGGPNSRSNQLFINLGDNVRLDKSDFNDVVGFPAFGNVVKGMDVVESINSEYKQEPNQDSIRVQGNRYLIKNFPNLDYIISAKIVE